MIDPQPLLEDSSLLSISVELNRRLEEIAKNSGTVVLLPILSGDCNDRLLKVLQCILQSCERLKIQFVCYIPKKWIEESPELFPEETYKHWLTDTKFSEEDEKIDSVYKKEFNKTFDDLDSDIRGQMECFIKHCLYWKRLYQKLFILTNFTPIYPDPHKVLNAFLVGKLDAIPVRTMELVSSKEPFHAKETIKNVIFTLCMHEGNYTTSEEFGEKLKTLLGNYDSHRIIVVIADTLDRYNRDPNPIDDGKGRQLIKDDQVLQARVGDYRRKFSEITARSTQEHEFHTWDDFVEDRSYRYYFDQYQTEAQKGDFKDQIKTTAIRYLKKPTRDDAAPDILERKSMKYLIEEGTVAFMQLATYYPGVVIYDGDDHRGKIIRKSLCFPLKQLTFINESPTEDYHYLSNPYPACDRIMDESGQRFLKDILSIFTAKQQISYDASLNLINKIAFALAYLSSDYLPLDILENMVIKAELNLMRKFVKLLISKGILQKQTKSILETTPITKENFKRFISKLGINNINNFIYLFTAVLEYYQTNIENFYKEEVNKTGKYFVHFEKCQQLLEALLTCEDIKSISEKNLEFNRKLADIALAIADFHLTHSKVYDKAIPYFHEALKFYDHLEDYSSELESLAAKEIKDTRRKASFVHFQLGVAYSKCGDDEAAILHKRKAIEIELKQSKYEIELVAPEEISQLRLIADRIYLYCDENQCWHASLLMTQQMAAIPINIPLPSWLKEPRKTLDFVTHYILYQMYEQYGVEEIFGLSPDDFEGLSYLGYKYYGLAIPGCRTMLEEDLEISKFYLQCTQNVADKMKTVSHKKDEKRPFLLREPKLLFAWIQYLYGIIALKSAKPDLELTFKYFAEAEKFASDDEVTKNDYPDLWEIILEHRAIVHAQREEFLEAIKNVEKSIKAHEDTSSSSKKVLLRYEVAKNYSRAAYYYKCNKDIGEAKRISKLAMDGFEGPKYAGDNQRYNELYIESLVNICSVYLNDYLIGRKDESIKFYYSLLAENFKEMKDWGKSFLLPLKNRALLYIAIIEVLLDKSLSVSNLKLDEIIKTMLTEKQKLVEIHVAYDLYQLGCECDGEDRPLREREIARQLFLLSNQLYEALGNRDLYPTAELVAKKIRVIKQVEPIVTAPGVSFFNSRDKNDKDEQRPAAAAQSTRENYTQTM